MAPITWQLLLAAASLSSATETCDQDHSVLLQSHVTSHKSVSGSAVDQLSFPKVATLTDPGKRKMALAQFENTAKELALNRAAVTPVVVEVCTATSELLRDTVMSKIVEEHDTDVAMLATAYAAFDPVEAQRLEYVALIANAVGAVYGPGGWIERHTQCRITEREEYCECSACEQTCTETESECDLAEVELRLRLDEVTEQISTDAYCDENGHIHPATEHSVVTVIEHELNRPKVEAYLLALAALEGCDTRRDQVCVYGTHAPAATSLLAVSQRQSTSPVHPDPSTLACCANHSTIRTECNSFQQQLQSAQCSSRHSVSGYLTLYEAAFLAAVQRYEQEKASTMIREADRKVEWDTLERVICLLMTLTNDEDGSASSDANADLIEACQTDDVDTSHLDIVYLVMPDMGDLPDLPHNPCGDEFAEDAYSDALECLGNVLPEFQDLVETGILPECVCLAEALDETHIGFPYELGPFLLFNAGFEFNVATGFEVTGAGTDWTATTGDTQYTGRLSPFVSVALPDLDAAFGLSADDSVAQVAWAYGDAQGTTDMILHGEEYPETMQHRFVRTGGFVYRNARGFVVALKEMSPSSSSLGQDAQLTLYFDSPQEVAESLVLAACPVMSPINLGRLLDAGAEEYCWEFSNAIALCDHGCFIYRTATHGYLAFPVVEAPESVEAPGEHIAATDQQGAPIHTMHTGWTVAGVTPQAED